MLDLPLIADTNKRYFEIQFRRVDMLMYKNSYPHWVDNYPFFPRGGKTPDFTTFSRKNDKSAMEHIERFTSKCIKGNNHEFRKLYLSSLSDMNNIFLIFFYLAKLNINSGRYVKFQ